MNLGRRQVVCMLRVLTLLEFASSYAAPSVLHRKNRGALLEIADFAESCCGLCLPGSARSRNGADMHARCVLGVAHRTNASMELCRKAKPGASFPAVCCMLCWVAHRAACCAVRCGPGCSCLLRICRILDLAPGCAAVRPPCTRASVKSNSALSGVCMRGRHPSD